MNKHPLKDVTFIIILSLDSIHRVENLLTSMLFISRYFDTNMLVFEVSNSKTSFLKKLLSKDVTYVLKHDRDPIFYRTKYINEATMLTNTDYIAIWDVDVIAAKTQIVEAIEALRTNTYDFVYPYEDYFYDVPEVIRRIFIEKKDLKVLKQTTSLHKPLYTPGPVGGAFMVNRRRYIEAGMENEHFYGWGPEDRERYIRWYKLGYKVGRIKGPLYHLYHTRGINSTFHDPIQDQIKDSESYAFNRMTKEQLRSEVDRWKWVPKTTK